MIWLLLLGFSLILVGLSGYIVVREDAADEGNQSNFSWNNDYMPKLRLFDWRY